MEIVGGYGADLPEGHGFILLVGETKLATALRELIAAGIPTGGLRSKS
jgi:hypothetical protein